MNKQQAIELEERFERGEVKSYSMFLGCTTVYLTDGSVETIRWEVTR